MPKGFVAAALCLLGCFASGCASEVALELEVSVTPESPLPGANNRVEVVVTDGVRGLESGEVVVEVYAGEVLGETLTLADEGEGRYGFDALAFATEGAWELAVSVTAAGSQSSDTVTVQVTCGADRAVAGLCCEHANCLDGLWCSASTCSDAGERPIGAPCATHDQCAGYFWCDPNGMCSNAIRPVGAPCASGVQCLTNFCIDEVCIDPPYGILGHGDTSPESVVFEVVWDEGMFEPSDLAFDPLSLGTLWVVNPPSDHLTVIIDADTDDPTVLHYYDSSKHFLEEVNTISFGDQGTFATCNESRNTYDGFGPPDNFMGPVHWPSNVAEFDEYGPDAAAVHLDMLHSTPHCMGIASSGGSGFYAFNGYYGALDWYDFNEPHGDVPHGHGGEDHTDGEVIRFPEVDLSRKAGVPSTMVYDKETEWLYIADTGNRRVLRVYTTAVFDTTRMPTFPFDGTGRVGTGVVQEDVVPPDTVLVAPSGIALHQGYLFVTDNSTGWIHAFTTEGELVHSLNTGLGAGALAGVTVGPDGLLYLVDQIAEEVLRIIPWAEGQSPVESANAEVSLVDPELWDIVPADEDPFAPPSGDTTALCTEEDTHLIEADDGTYFDIDTSTCSWVTVTQPIQADVKAGATLTIWGLRWTNVAGVGEARFTVGFGDPVKAVWEDRPMLPADPELYYEEIVITEDLPAGTPAIWHVSNHGENVWSLIDLLVVNP